MKESTKIVVISLRESSDRRESVKKQFALIDTDFKFFNAITPEDSLKHIYCYDAREYITNSGRPATATEIACYASHRSLWQQCAEENRPYLILEDDVELDDSFLTGLLIATSQVQKLGFIRVSVPSLHSSVLVNRLGSFSLRFCRRVPLLALGYIISPAAARQLADSSSVIQEPVDKCLQRYWRHRQNIFAMDPPIVRLSSHAEKSDIGHRAKRSPDGRLWLRRAARKIHNSVARTTFGLFALEKFVLPIELQT